MNRTYVIDFLNIFSDYREIKYKQNGIDFHTIKHEKIKEDTLEFFSLFFTKYIGYINIKSTNNFIFVMKKLNDYDVLLDQVLKSYPSINIQFLVIEDDFSDVLLDKNKDDFLCQYIMFCTKGSTLISNDQYRDRFQYMKKYIKIRTTLIKKDDKCPMDFDINKTTCYSNMNKECVRCTIPKQRLNIIL